MTSIAASVSRLERGPSVTDTSVAHEAESLVLTLLGTTVAANVPLMSAGMDSITAIEFTRMLSDAVGDDLPSTLIFDHPTINSIAGFVTSELIQRANEREGEMPQHSALNVAEQQGTVEQYA